MKIKKILNRNQLCAMTIILITVIALICISCSGIITAHAEVANSPIGFEQKEYSQIDIDEEFDDSCVVVVMDKYSSGINKSHSAKFAKFPFVKTLEDLTIITGKIEEKLYLNKTSFRQIIKIGLKEHSKQNVLDAISQLQKIDGVLWAGENGYMQPAELPTDTPNAVSGKNYQEQWGLHQAYGINAPNAWMQSIGSKSVKVGIIDSGIEKHEDLADNIVPGWNFIENNDKTEDTFGHGTSVAGIIGANGTAENGILGVSWKVQIAPLKVDYIVETVDENGNKEEDTKFSSYAIANAITWSIDNDVDIINLSAGGYYEDLSVKSAINNFTGLFVCSAGNEANDNDIKKCYPSDYSYGQEFSNRVITVGAIKSNGNIRYNSNYGQETVSIFAPGDKVLSTCISANDSSGYKEVSGTSHAAPHVAGVAALLYSQYKYNTHNLQNTYIASQVKSTILWYSTYDERYNDKCITSGRLNAEEALKHVAYRKDVMKGFGYNDGRYDWGGKVDLNIDKHDSFKFNENDELVFNYATDFSFAVGSTSFFNAVTDMYATLTFELRNSSGEIVQIDGKDSHICEVKISIFSIPLYTDNIFTLRSSKLENDRYTLTMNCTTSRKDTSYSYRRDFSFVVNVNTSCIADDSLITLSDGSQVAVQDLTGDEELLVWNMHTGTFDTAPILFIDKEAKKQCEVTNLYFSDGTSVKVIDEHGFWDFNLNQYVFLRNDADKYIGHWFNKQTVDKDGNLSYTKVQLTDVKVQTETTSAWSPVTYGHLCYYVNGMLSMPGATEGLINIFEVDSQTMKIDEEAYLADIEKYGLFTYEEFAEICPVPQTIFEAVDAQYLKVAIGKGIITIEEIQNLVSRYSKFWQ